MYSYVAWFGCWYYHGIGILGIDLMMVSDYGIGLHITMVKVSLVLA